MIRFKTVLFSSLIALQGVCVLFATENATAQADSNLLLTMPPVLAPREPATRVSLSAFNDFSCTANWGNRDGALGLIAYTGAGSCEAVFPGVSSTYTIILTVQTEFDGQPPYRVSINGQTVAQGTYPLSSSLGCNCPLDQWHTVCPDKNVDINLGNVRIQKGDIITFWGDQVYPCGHEHGAYAKWHSITFIPVE